MQNKCDVHCQVPLQTTFGKIHRTVWVQLSRHHRSRWRKRASEFAKSLPSVWICFQISASFGDAFGRTQGRFFHAFVTARQIMNAAWQTHNRCYWIAQTTYYALLSWDCLKCLVSGSCTTGRNLGLHGCSKRSWPSQDLQVRRPVGHCFSFLRATRGTSVFFDDSLEWCWQFGFRLARPWRHRGVGQSLEEQGEGQGQCWECGSFEIPNHCWKEAKGNSSLTWQFQVPSASVSYRSVLVELRRERERDIYIFIYFVDKYV